MTKYSFSKVAALFRKFGGWRLIRAYWKLGVLGVAVRSVIIGAAKRRSADKIYYSYEPRVVAALKRQYELLMKEKVAEYERVGGEQVRSDVVWFCWLQGLEFAPPVVKACYASLKRNLQGKEIRVIDEKNRLDYIQFPSYIERRYDKGQIPPAMFADLIRLELLIKYGGTWIDATVLCSGPDYPREYLDADLFFFQYARPEDKKYAGISNWFITSCSYNPLLMTLRDMLYAYWADFDCVVEYFIFHRFFDMLAEARPDVIAQMPYGFSPQCHVLLRHWAEPFDQEKWDKVTTRVCFHKLAHQVDGAVKEDRGNYYSYIIGELGKERV